MQAPRSLSLLIVFLAGPLLSGGSDLLLYRPQFHGRLPQAQVSADSDTVAAMTPAMKYPARGLIMSLAVPGAGQWYAGAKWKALGFAAVELAGWVAWYQMRKDGDESQTQYEEFADDHWILRLWVEYSDMLRFQDEEKYGDVSVKGTHHLSILMPDESVVSSDTLESVGYVQGMMVIRDRDFYENIGKYDQFVAGWDDTGLQEGKELWWDFEKQVGDTTEWIVMTHNRDRYLDLREEHNKLLQWAGYAASTLMFNHVASAIEAAWETRRRSAGPRKVETSLKPLFSPYARFGIGGISLSLSW